MTPALAPARPGLDLDDIRRRLVEHRLYALVDSPEKLRRFMEHHVFAVWDFQCLLKALQRKLTGTTVPWLPTPDREARRLVNEIVLDEESDELPDGGHASHFELYLESMEAAGADTGPVRRLLGLVREGVPVAEALVAAAAPPAAAAFVRHTFTIIDSDSAVALAAAFTFGREDVIPDMFRHLVASLAERDAAAWGLFRFYLERHITHDDTTHGPLCRRLVERLCGADDARWAEAVRTARGCLAARIALWDGIAATL